MNPTEEQQRVVDAPLAGPHLVDAGAGTGKTFTLVERAAALVASGKLEPQNLLVVTFTRAAATEIARTPRAALRRARSHRKAHRAAHSTRSRQRYYASSRTRRERRQTFA